MKTLVLLAAMISSSVCLAHRTAQEAAEASARGGLAHRGGNPAYEGLGCASTPEAAYKRCCYANHTGLITYDVGYAQARNGLWVCCRRYVSKSRAHLIPKYLEKAGLTKKVDEVEDVDAVGNSKTAKG